MQHNNPNVVVTPEEQARRDKEKEQQEIRNEATRKANAQRLAFAQYFAAKNHIGEWINEDSPEFQAHREKLREREQEGDPVQLMTGTNSSATLLKDGTYQNADKDRYPGMSFTLRNGVVTTNRKPETREQFRQNINAMIDFLVTSTGTDTIYINWPSAKHVNEDFLNIAMNEVAKKPGVKLQFGSAVTTYLNSAQRDPDVLGSIKDVKHNLKTIKDTFKNLGKEKDAQISGESQQARKMRVMDRLGQINALADKVQDTHDKRFGLQEVKRLQELSLFERAMKESDKLAALDGNNQERAKEIYINRLLGEGDAKLKGKPALDVLEKEAKELNARAQLMNDALTALNADVTARDAKLQKIIDDTAAVNVTEEALTDNQKSISRYAKLQNQDPTFENMIATIEAEKKDLVARQAVLQHELNTLRERVEADMPAGTPEEQQAKTALTERTRVVEGTVGENLTTLFNGVNIAAAKTSQTDLERKFQTARDQVHTKLAEVERAHEGPRAER